MKSTTFHYIPMLLCLLAIAIAASPADADEAADVQAKREQAFVAQLANCTLVGSFTVDGKTDGPPKAERYEIEGVTKVAGNLWTFMTRVKYGKVDSRLPITVPVEWAGDTPMVSLTNASIPGLGDEFSARVIFYQNRYAGTWQHGKAGGHMFGTIEHRKDGAAPNAAPQ